MTPIEGLQRELSFYESHKNELLETHKGFYVLIKGDEVVGVFPSAEAAYAEGLNRFDLQPFLVKQILDTEPVGFVPTFFVTTTNAGL